MSVPNAIELYLVNKLNTDSDVFAAVNGRIHVSVAPSGVTTPHIILSRRSGDAIFAFSENYRQFMQDTSRYNVKVVTEVRQGGLLQGDQIFQKVWLALKGTQDSVVATDGKTYYINIPEKEDDIRFVSRDNDIDYAHVGGVFLILVYPNPAEV